jgi:ABC-type hemin transport system substrate-binding protein
VHTLITDAAAPEQGLQMLRDAGVETVVVQPEAAPA